MRFSMYRCLIAIVVLAGLLGYSVIQAEKEESAIEKYTRLHNELASTYKELILHVRNNPELLDKSNYHPDMLKSSYYEKNPDKIEYGYLFKSIANAKFQQIRYESITQVKSKNK